MAKVYKCSNKKISGILSVVPKNTVRFIDELDNYNLSKERGLEMQRTIGLYERRLVQDEECASDLCLYGLENLINNNFLKIEDIGAIIFVTQTPDHFMPPTSSIIQGKLNCSKDVLCFDINQGCAGYLYGLFQAFMLLDHIDKKVLLLNGDTLSRRCCPYDRNIYPLIGDAGSITIVEKSDDQDEIYLNLQSDGTRYDWLIIPAGAFRKPSTEQTREIKLYPDGNKRSEEDFYMNGAGVFTFTQVDVPLTIKELFEKTNIRLEEIDYFMFHQPNRFMLQKLAKKLGVSEEKLPNNIVGKFGNSSSVSIPVNICWNIANILLERRLKICMSGFGVGLSWGTLIMNMGPLEFCSLVEK